MNLIDLRFTDPVSLKYRKVTSIVSTFGGDIPAISETLGMPATLGYANCINLCFQKENFALVLS